MIVRLTSPEAESCHQFLQKFCKQTKYNDEETLTWYVSANFLYKAYLDWEWRRGKNKPLTYPQFESIVRVTFPKCQRKKIAATGVNIFTNIRYEVDGVTYWGD